MFLFRAFDSLLSNFVIGRTLPSFPRTQSFSPELFAQTWTLLVRHKSSSLCPFYLTDTAEYPGEYSDERLFEVLTLVGLYEKKAERRGSSNSLTSLSSADKGAGGRTQPVKSLSEEVSEGGTNFSVGQRQLLVIARTMLAGASIVIMDEATASVDADTDARIQRVFRSEFKNATCITVAHRLNVSYGQGFYLQDAFVLISCLFADNHGLRLRACYG